MKGQLRIDQLFAFVMVDEDGTEGVPAFFSPAAQIVMPMMGADLARVADLLPLAQTDPTFRGKRIEILRFSTREVIGVIDRTHETTTKEDS